MLAVVVQVADVEVTITLEVVTKVVGARLVVGGAPVVHLGHNKTHYIKQTNIQNTETNKQQTKQHELHKNTPLTKKQ